MTYDSRLAQELAKWADTQPGGEAIHDALFRAYFVDGLSLALLENLLAIAEQVGLDRQQAREVLQRRSMRSAVDADWQRAARPGSHGRTDVCGWAPGRRRCSAVRGFAEADRSTRGRLDVCQTPTEFPESNFSSCRTEFIPSVLPDSPARGVPKNRHTFDTLLDT